MTTVHKGEPYPNHDFLQQVIENKIQQQLHNRKAPLMFTITLTNDEGDRLEFIPAPNGSLVIVATTLTQEDKLQWEIPDDQRHTFTEYLKGLV